MQLIYSVIVPILFTLCSCRSTKEVINCNKCSVEFAVKAINKNHINEQIIEKLFCTAEDSCQINAEFLEVFNEALFVCLGKAPEIFVKLFSISSKQEFILKQLESPINDTINLKEIIEKLTKIPNEKHADSYNKILQALNLAKKKMQSFFYNIKYIPHLTVVAAAAMPGIIGTKAAISFSAQAVTGGVDNIDILGVTSDD